MTNYPYRWFANIARLLEKRAYSTFTLATFAAFVGAGRLIGEAVTGSQVVLSTFADFFGFWLFYWQAFFLYALVLYLLVDQPWRRSINVILVGIFFGLMPPVLDFLIAGFAPVRYMYFRGFPADWNVWIVNPALGVPPGEAIVLWATILFTALYVAHKTRSVLRAAAALLLAYAVVVYESALLVVPVDWLITHGLMPEARWNLGSFSFLLYAFQIFTAVGLYAIFQPRVAAHLLRRSLHATPFLLIAWCGAAFVGKPTWDLLIYTGFLWLIFVAALAQNDYYDAQEDAAAGRGSPLDLEDVRFFNVTAVAIVVLLLVMNSMVGVAMLGIAVTTVLYSYPFYRGKRYFPSNLKMEGVWGGGSFLVGAFAAQEFAAFGHPRWQLAHLPSPLSDMTPPGAFSLQTIAAWLLVFGGYSLVAALKDYKDVEADRAAGVQTLYTLALRRGVAPARVNRVLAVLAGASLGAPFVILWVSGSYPLGWLGAGAAAAASVWGAALTWGRSRFARVLVSLDLALAALLAMLLSR